MILPLLLIFAAKALVTALASVLALALLLSRTARAALFALPGRNEARLLASVAAGAAYIAASSVWSINPGEAWQLAARLLAIAGLGMGLRRVWLTLPAPSMRTLGGMALATCASMGLLALESLSSGGILKFVFVSLADANFERFMEKSVNRGLCAMSVLVWPLAWALWQHGRKRLTLALLLTTTLTVMGMESLSARLGLLAGAVVMVLPVWWLRALPYAVAGFLFSVPWLMALILHSPLTDGLLPWLERFSSGRFSIWGIFLQVWQDRPLLGFGAATASYMPISAELLRNAGLAFPPAHPHNAPLQWLVELGLPGLGGMAAAAGAALYAARGRRVLQATIVAYICAGLFAFNAWQFWWLATGILAVIFTCNTILQSSVG